MMGEVKYSIQGERIDGNEENNYKVTWGEDSAATEEDFGEFMGEAAKDKTGYNATGMSFSRHHFSNSSSSDSPSC